MCVCVYYAITYTHLFMEKKPFDYLWDLLYEHGAVESQKGAAEMAWDRYTIEKQRLIYQAIRDKLREGRFVQYNPVRAILENAPRAPVMKIISSDAYYQMYGTQEEKDGWTRKFLPNQHKTIYYKQN